MRKLRDRENRKIGYYAFEYRHLGKRKLIDESFVFSTTEKENQITASKLGEFAIFNADLLKNTGKADKYFVKAIKKNPKNSFWLGNYAIFLHFYKRDMELAKKFYEISLRINNDDPFLLFNYSILLIFEVKDYHRAEKYLRKAIELDPEYLKYKITYAGFLFKVKKNNKKAEDIFKELLKKNNNNPLILANYAQFKIFTKNFQKAKEFIDKAFSLNPSDDIKLELWFYRYAHYPEWEEKAEYEMNKLIKYGIKTSSWGFHQNVVISIFMGHRFPEKLEEYAKTIEGVYKL